MERMRYALTCAASFRYGISKAAQQPEHDKERQAKALCIVSSCVLLSSDTCCTQIFTQSLLLSPTLSGIDSHLQPEIQSLSFKQPTSSRHLPCSSWNES